MNTAIIVRSFYCPIFGTNILVLVHRLMSLIVLYCLLYDHHNQVYYVQILDVCRNACIVYLFVMLQIYNEEKKESSFFFCLSNINIQLFFESSFTEYVLNI